VGAVVALAAAAFWIILAWRRHNTRKLEGVAIGTAPNSARLRQPIDDEDDEDLPGGQPMMTERMRGGQLSYADPRTPSGYGAVMMPRALRSNPGEEDGLMVDELDAQSSSEDVSSSQGRHSARFGAGASSAESAGVRRRSNPTGSTIGFGQAAEEMAGGVAVAEPPRAASPQARARDSMGIDPAAWLGGHVVVAAPHSPTAVSSGHGHTGPSSQGHSGSSSEFGVLSSHAGGSSTLQHSGSGLGAGPSSQEQGAGSSSSGHGHDKQSLISGEGPTQSEGHRSTSGWFEAGGMPPPSSYPIRGADQTGGARPGVSRSPSQKSFFSRSLRWKSPTRRGPHSQPTSAAASQVDISEPRAQGGSASSPNVPAFFASAFTKGRGANSPPPQSQSSRQPLFSGPPPPPATLRRINNPGPMQRWGAHEPGRPSIASLAGEVGDVEVEPYVPQRHWPGLSPGLTLPPLPSPAITEGSGDAREGLLDPNIGDTGDTGMISPSVVSLADHRDYTRPIGAVSLRVTIDGNNIAHGCVLVLVG
jgi:hypothetical protein